MYDNRIINSVNNVLDSQLPDSAFPDAFKLLAGWNNDDFRGAYLD